MFFATVQLPKPAAVVRPSRPSNSRRQFANPLSPTSTLHPIVQAKLRIGAPNDKYEREADRAAICRGARPLRIVLLPRRSSARFGPAAGYSDDAALMLFTQQ